MVPSVAAFRIRENLSITQIGTQLGILKSGGNRPALAFTRLKVHTALTILVTDFESPSTEIRP